MATLTPKELAIKLGTDAKTLRKYLRSVTPRDAQPGKGHRWSIEANTVKTHKAAFAKWDKERKELIAARKAAEAAAAAEAAEALDATESPEGDEVDTEA